MSVTSALPSQLLLDTSRQPSPPLFTDSFRVLFLSPLGGSREWACGAALVKSVVVHGRTLASRSLATHPRLTRSSAESCRLHAW